MQKEPLQKRDAKRAPHCILILIVKYGFSWTFEELDGCGWTWSNSSSVLTISNSLNVVGNPHQLTHGGVTIEVGTQVDPLDISCDYSTTVTVGAGFIANHTTFGQNGDTSGATDFTSAFIIELNEFNHTENSTYASDGVMVGEELQVNSKIKGPFCVKTLQRKKQNPGNFGKKRQIVPSLFQNPRNSQDFQNPKKIIEKK